MEQDRKYFFFPREGTEYKDGYKGYRTLVVGAYHVCIHKCPYAEECSADSSKFERKCPVYIDRYTGKDGYYRISNSNRIEIDSFMEPSENYPAYSAFTQFMLNKYNYADTADRESLWEHVVFCNYLQNFRRKYDPIEYKGNEELFDRDFEAFREIIAEYSPEVLYVWHDSVKEVIDRNIRSIPGLEFIDTLPIRTLKVHRYILSVKSKFPPEKILSDILEKTGMKYGPESLRKLLKGIRRLRNMDYENRDTEKVYDTLLSPHIWDKALIQHLERSIITASIGDGKAEDLKRITEGLYKDNYTVSPAYLQFSEDEGTPGKALEKYSQSGIVSVIMDELGISSGMTRKKGCITEGEFTLFMHYTSSEDEWRKKLKKEYTERIEENNGLKNKVKNIVLKYLQ